MADVGAAGSTGRGEANLYNLCSFVIVEEMRRGAHPKDAGMEVLKRIKANTIEKRLLKAGRHAKLRHQLLHPQRQRRVRRRLDVPGQICDVQRERATDAEHRAAVAGTRLSPPLNHWWNCVLYVTPRGLTTSAIPYHGELFEMEFDFIDHKLAIRKSDGQTRSVKLEPRSVADFYGELMSTLQQIGIDVKIWTMPQEVPNPIPFEKDHEHASYDREYANRFWRILVQADSIFNEFRARFVGKSSPVHFFWGSFDLAVTRFSGRAAPERPGADPTASCFASA